jgi:hypothetical protein
MTRVVSSDDASRGRCAGREVGLTGTEPGRMVIVAPELGLPWRRRKECKAVRFVDCYQRVGGMHCMYCLGDHEASISSSQARLGPVLHGSLAAAAASDCRTIMTSSACLPLPLSRTLHVTVFHVQMRRQKSQAAGGVQQRTRQVIVGTRRKGLGTEPVAAAAACQVRETSVRSAAFAKRPSLARIVAHRMHLRVICLLLIRV